MKKQIIKMQYISESQRREHSIIRMTSNQPVIRSSGTLDCICASCGTVLFDGVGLKQAAGLVIQCGGCGCLNAMPQNLPAEVAG